MSRRSRHRSARPLRKLLRNGAIEALEDRITPVVGAFDIPAAMVAGSGFDGVARVGLATGTLMSTGRHILTAAHVGDQSTGPGSGSDAQFRVLDANFNAKSITTPATERFPHFEYDTDPGNRDIAVIELAELAPLNAERWEIYTDDDEVGQTGRMVGYGATGTGTTGLATDIKTGQYHATDIGAGTNYEIVRFTIAGNPTGGHFVPRLSGEIPPVLSALPYNVTAAQLEVALQNLIGGGDVQVRLVGDTDMDGVVENNGHPHAGSFEALFLGADFSGAGANNHAMPDVFATDTFTGGNNPRVIVETILQGGSAREKRSGYNRVGDVGGDDSRILADFDDGTAAGDTLDGTFGQGANEGYGSFGDSGSALFIDGKIAGVLDALLSDPDGEDGVQWNCSFGEQETWARVSYYENWINNILDNSFDLVLNMDNQPWGNDGLDDSISVSRLGGSLRITINGVLRYSENIGLIDSVTIRGSGDDDTISVADLGANIPVVLNGKGGNDTLRLTGLAVGATASLYGGNDDDAIHVGTGDYDERIRGDVFVYGGTGDDFLVLDDQEDANNNAMAPDIYTMTATTYYKTNPWGAVVTFDSHVDSVRVDANPQDNAFFINSTAPGREVQVFGNGGNDEFVVGNTNFAANITGDLLVHGGFGSDRLVLNNSAVTANDTHTLDVDTYTTDIAIATLTFQFLQDVELTTGTGHDVVDLLGTMEDTDVEINTGNGSDTVNVHAVHATSTVSIDTGAHSDTVALSPVQDNLDPIDGALTVNMGSGTSDDLLIHDEAPAISAGTYTVASSAFDASGFGSLSYATTENVTLWCDNMSNTVNVNSLASSVNLALRTLGGNDLVRVGGGDLDSNVWGDISLQGGAGDDTLQLNDGSDDVGNDSYTLGNGTFTKTGIDSWSYIQLENVTLNASPFDNTVNVTSLGPVDLTINAFTGNDTIHIGSGRADIMQGNVVVNGSTGDDTIHINAQDTPGGHTYTMAGQTFDMNSAFFGSLSYTSIADFILHAGNSNDTVNLQSSVLSTAIAVHAGGGNDTVQIGTGDVDAIGGDVTVQGNAGTDSVMVNDQNDAGSDVYTVTSTSISKTGFLLSVGTVEAVTLNAGAENNTVNVTSTALGRPVTINAGAGDDTIHLSPTTQSLNQLVGAVTVNGQAGSDNVIAHDEALVLGVTYNLSASSLTRASFGGLTFGTIEQLHLNQGRGNDTVNAAVYSLDVLFTLFGSAGNDTYNVACNGALGSTGARLRINGGAPSGVPNGDRLNVSYLGVPTVAHIPDLLTPGSGDVAIQYPAALYDIAYDDIEGVGIGPVLV